MSKHRYLLPGPGKLVVEPLPTSQELDIGGGKKLWLAGDNRDAIMATVVAVCDRYSADGEEREPQYAKGAIVLIGKFVGTKVTIDRTRELIVVAESAIVAELVEVEDAPESPT